MKVGDYVRTKKRCFQFQQIAKITNMVKDSGYNNQYYITLDHNLLPDYEFTIYEEDIIKSSPNIIDLIEAGDYVNGIYIEENNGKYLETLEDDYDNSRLGHIEFIKIYPNDIKSIVTKEQFESMEYKVC